MPSPEPRPPEEVLGVVTAEAFRRRERRTQRRRGLALASVVVAVTAVGGALLLVRGESGRAGRVTSGPGLVGPPPTYDRDPLTEPEGWTPMGAAPLSARGRPVTAWTGEELLVWRGNGAFSDAGGGEPGRTDGAAYDPVTDTWRAMADAPLPPPENAIGASEYASAWTGRELIVWGGPGPGAAAYDPADDSWRSIDPGPLSARNQPAFAWTGTELVIIGGYAPFSSGADDEGMGAREDGAAYDPATDTWRSLPASGLTTWGEAVWAGTTLLLVGGSSESGDGEPAWGAPTVALALDPGATEWRQIAEPPLSDLRATPVWTGTELVAFGVAAGASEEGPGGERLTDPAAATFDPATDTWATVEPPGGFALDQLDSPVAVWSGREVLLLGGYGPFTSGREPVRGFAFDPATRSWRGLPDPGISDRSGMGAAWTGTELLVWGGAYSTGFTSEPKDDGWRYRPGPDR